MKGLILKPIVLIGVLMLSMLVITAFVLKGIFNPDGHNFSSTEISIVITRLIGIAALIACFFLFVGLRKKNKEIQETYQKKQQAETELLGLREKAETANQSKRNFLANISHEMRTPLNGILGFSDILLNTSLPKKEQDEYLQHIKTSGNILLKLISDILEFNKMETGKIEIKHETFQLREFFRQDIEVYAFQVKEKGLAFEMTVDDGVPDFVITDRFHLQQILVYLLGNAIKFTDTGKVGIDIKKVKEYDDSALLKLSVYDTGIGITSDNHEKVFESFSQANDTAGRQFGGSGLGLAIVKHLVNAMGGSIRLFSPSPYNESKTINRGTCFEILLPVDICRESKLKAEVLEETPSKQAQKMHVLIVEDNLLNQKLASFILKKIDCHAEIASNGLEALEMIGKQNYDLILMDIQMPVMDGLQASMAIRKELRLDIPIVALTANTFSEDVENCMNAGMNDHLGKPYKEEQLIQIVNKWGMKKAV
jgi:signal transduction histidine kinase/ActR/RegA family two-component response regulator